jgi:hypothetical protein
MLQLKSVQHCGMDLTKYPDLFSGNHNIGPASSDECRVI